MPSRRPPWPRRQSSRAAVGSLGSGGGMPGAALPEEIIAEILARVWPDPALLFRCALVCKRWRGLLADPAFLRLVLPEPEAAGRSSPSSLLGFLVQRRRPLVAWWGRIATLFRNRAPAFVPAPGSALGPRRRFLTSFVRGGAAGLLEDAEPLAERGGLVLLRLFFPARAAAAGRKPLSLCVCSLLTGKLDVLPCFDGGRVRGYAVLPSPSTDHGGTPQRPADGYSNLCKVLLVSVHPGSNQLNIHSFSTAAAAAAAAFQNWDTTPVNGFSGDAGPFSGPYGSSVPTICCDMARWFFQKDGPTGPTMFTVDVSIDTGRVCTNMIILDGPVDLSIHARFLLIYGRFLFQKHNRLVIRTSSDIQDDEMLLVAVCVGEKSGTALGICCFDLGCAYFLDLQSKSTTTVGGWSRSFNYMKAVPFEINWPEFFMSRLGVQL